MRTRNAGAKRQGFTLIELIGVLAVMAIIAAMILPDMIKAITSAESDAEQQSLKNLAKGLEQHIFQNRTIPGTTAVAAAGGAPAVPIWDQAIADQVQLPVGKVNTNDRNQPRYYLWDNGVTPAIPYQQTSATASALTAGTRPRIIIISSIGPTLTGLASGGLATATFDTLWTWDENTPTALSAYGISTNDQAKQVRIQRINLEQFFNAVALSNRASTASGRTSFVSAATGTAQTVMTINASATANLTIGALRYNVYAFQTNMPDSLGTPISVSISSGATTFGTVANANAGSGGFITGAGTPLGPLTATTLVSVTMTLPAGYTSGSGTVDVDVDLSSDTYYNLDTETATTTIASSAMANLIVLQNTRLNLYNNATTPTVMQSYFITAADSFWFSPGPPAVWGR
ncbi:MAG: type II secretion system protein [Nitrospinae bacterium]|nr:type II secretion system protein [Nitrospinota bacterium]